MRTDDTGLDAPAHVCTPGLASLAVLGIIQELLLFKVKLLVSAEDKFLSAINTSQDPVGEFRYANGCFLHCEYGSSRVICPGFQDLSLNHFLELLYTGMALVDLR
jgi:hypothetical protein